MRQESGRRRRCGNEGARESVRRVDDTGYRRGILALLFALWVCFGNAIARAFEADTPSTSYGTPDSGSMEAGKRLPTAGPNFAAYSRLRAALGRSSVNSKVRDVVVEAVALHLAALDEAATAHGLCIDRVIFAPEFIPRVEAVPGAWRLVDRLPWFQGTAGIRHDEHYHVDFR